MSATLLDGSALAKELRAALKEEAAAFAAQHGFAPALAVLRVGGDPASGGYARAIEKLCKNTGLGFRAVELGDDAAQADAQAALAALNGDPAVHGIMILEPVPATIDHAALVDSLDPAKDVDGVHPLNAGRLAQQKQPCFVPATPAGGIRGGEQSIFSLGLICYLNNNLRLMTDYQWVDVDRLNGAGDDAGQQLEILQGRVQFKF